MTQCNCISEIEQATLEHLQKNAPKQEKITGGHLLGTGFTFASGFSLRKTYNDYEARVTPIKKDGSDGKERKKTIAIHHTYCPFCGGRYKEEKK